jgi:polar amino acid transport system permease protein
MIAGIVLGLFLALGKTSKFFVINRFCSAYIFFFRSTPLIMQLLFVYYGLPSMSPALAINDRFLAAFVTLALNSGAYCSEIIRAALQSIDKGQFEASHALGMTYAQTMQLVIIPQSIRRLIPPMGNEFLMLLKDVSATFVISLVDLTTKTRQIHASTNNVIVYLPAMVIYMVITAIFTYIFQKLEKKYSIYE